MSVPYKKKPKMYKAHRIRLNAFSTKIIFSANVMKIPFKMCFLHIALKMIFHF